MFLYFCGRVYNGPYINILAIHARSREQVCFFHLYMYVHKRKREANDNLMKVYHSDYKANSIPITFKNLGSEYMFI